MGYNRAKEIMKKIALIAVAVFSFFIVTPMAHAQVATTSAAWSAAKLIGKVGLAVYSVLPNASYALTVEAQDGSVSHSKVDSCDQALTYALRLLENGAKRVTIVSEHTTVHPSCRGKAYTQDDIDYLREKVG